MHQDHSSSRTEQNVNVSRIQLRKSRKLCCVKDRHTPCSAGLEGALHGDCIQRARSSLLPNTYIPRWQGVQCSVG